MKKYKHFLLFAFITSLVACNQDDKTAEIILEEIEFGAVIRTLDFNNGEFDVNRPESLFSVNVEEQDKENGGLFAGIDVYVQFVDNTLDNGDLSTSETLLETISPEAFAPGGPDGLPRGTIEYSFGELAEATGVSVENVLCKDQFVLRLDLQLTDGRSFTTTDAVALILAFDTFYSSPYTYTINVVEPIAEELFTGDYVFESVIDGPFGASFLTPMPTTIFKGHSNNVRRVLLWHYLSHKQLEAKRYFNFSIVCDEVVMEKYQLASVEANCTLGNGISGTGDLILIGPGQVNATINPNDDSVFEIEFVEGFEGWDGDCGFSNSPSRIRFTKQ